MIETGGEIDVLIPTRDRFTNWPRPWPGCR